jgi:hypothetical protein
MSKISLRTVFIRLIMLCTFAVLLAGTATTSAAQIRISVAFGPPALPVFEQPLCPGEGYIWVPGYWAWDPDFGDYYWVPGTWVLAPEVGYLWTPPYWAWADGGWAFYDGYWGPVVGFYGGINYGFGYFGYGYVGGRWDHGRFFYNRTVTNINIVNIHNVYEERVENVTVNRVSYNGGPGGVNARPRPEEEAAMRERHLGPVAAQTEHLQAARGNPELRASSNRGRPPVAATERAGDFRGGSVAAREAGAPYNPPANRGGNDRGGSLTHARDIRAFDKTVPNTGDPNRDRKYQQDQDKLYQKQEQERQKLQQQQQRDHDQMARKNADQARTQQMEQRHQQQSEQMQRRQVEQQQNLRQKYEPPPGRRK